MSKHEAVLSLEPSDLLAPIDLSEQRGEFEVPSLDRKVRSSVRLFARQAPDAPIVRIRRPRRWALRSAFVVAGALTCFGAGARSPELTTLASGVTNTWQTVESATERSEKATSAQTTSIPIKSAEANHTRAPNASAQPAPRVEGEAPPRGAAPAAGPCSRQAAPDDCLEGAVVSGSSRVAAAPPESARPGPQAQNPGSAQHASVPADAQQEKVQSSRQSRRALRQATADQRPRDKTDPVARDAVRRDSRDSARVSSSRREWTTDDNTRTARPDQDAAPEPNWVWNRYDESSGRNRSDDYARADNRRVIGRTPRQDDRVFGRAPRDEGPMMFRPFENNW
jgi:hypothetical protein